MSITSLKDFKQLKNAKIAYSHLQDILKVYNLTVKALDRPPLNIYMSVQKILNQVKAEKSILEAHLNKYKKIVEEEKNE